MKVRIMRVVAVVTALVLAAVASPVRPASAQAGFVPLSGSGSTWSENALTTWAAQVAPNGITISYAGTGSTAGRQAFENRTADFAVSEIPYGVSDGGSIDPGPNKSQLNYAYIPIVAGGTSFMYHLDSGNKRIVNLRLDGLTLAKIFTGVITTWNDPIIKGQNPGVSLPSRQIIPVVRSDGSGTSAQFTRWLSTQYPDIWNAYCKKLSLTSCGMFSFFPVPNGTSAFQALAGSTNVAGYVAQSYGEGAITYVEYSYAQNEHFPVVRLANDGGYYALPTDYNVAVALTHATIDPTTLEQILDGVYASKEPQAYPLSSYSYMIVPLQTDAQFTADKGKTLGEFAYYFLCQGQQYAGKLGYSPLPENLVSAAFSVIKQVPGNALGARSTDYSTCKNPTFDPNGGNNLAHIAPLPLSCDQIGSAAQCTGLEAPAPPRGNPAGATGSAGGTTGGSKAAAGGTSSTGGKSGGATGGSSAAAGGTSSTGGTTGGASSAGATGGAAGGTVAPDTSGGTSVSSDLLKAGGAPPIANPLTVGAGISDSLQQALMAIAAALLLGLAVGPPLLSRRLARNHAGSGGVEVVAGPVGVAMAERSDNAGPAAPAAPALSAQSSSSASSDGNVEGAATVDPDESARVEAPETPEVAEAPGAPELPELPGPAEAPDREAS